MTTPNPYRSINVPRARTAEADTDPFTQDLIGEIFGERPELAFLGNLGQANLPRGMEQFFRGRASDFLQRYQQAIGQQLAGGQLPTLRPEEFFSNIDFGAERFRFSPQARGEGTSRFAPPVRFLR